MRALKAPESVPSAIAPGPSVFGVTRIVSFPSMTPSKGSIFQLYGTVQLYLMDQGQALIPANVKAIFVTAAFLSPVAQRAAKWLGIKFKENYSLDKTYPMIKCNINQSTNERIYHLPFDQQYDRTKIIPALDECYVRTIAEAEKEAFEGPFAMSISDGFLFLSR